MGTVGNWVKVIAHQWKREKNKKCKERLRKREIYRCVKCEKEGVRRQDTTNRRDFKEKIGKETVS